MANGCKTTPLGRMCVLQKERPMELIENTTPPTETMTAPEAPTMSFDEFNLPPFLMEALAYLKFTNPTPIQAQAIPPAMEGKDILGSAQTGTGKTGAFGIPLIAKLLNSSRGTALIMTPTRELAVQVMAMLENLLGDDSGINTALLIGGESYPKQFRQLRNKPRVIVGTPGRINDHLERATLMLNDANTLVLDETDRMLDMGFGVQIDKIVSHMPQARQTMMFSATLPPNIEKLSGKYLNNPVRISTGSNNVPIERIKQENINLKEVDKQGQLMVQLQQREGSIIIFVKTKWGADKMAKKLSTMGHKADAIHGDLKQNQRDAVIRNFRAKQFRVLVATDIAARGLDIPHIEHVINYDLPQCAEDYVHRIGRTARAGAEGSALNLITPADNGKWKAIYRLLHPGEKPPHMEGGSEKPFKKKFGNRNGRNNKFRGNSRPQRSGDFKKAA